MEGGRGVVFGFMQRVVVRRLKHFAGSTARQFGVIAASDLRDNRTTTANIAYKSGLKKK